MIEKPIIMNQRIKHKKIKQNRSFKFQKSGLSVFNRMQLITTLTRKDTVRVTGRTKKFSDRFFFFLYRKFGFISQFHSFKKKKKLCKGKIKLLTEIIRSRSSASMICLTGATVCCCFLENTEVSSWVAKYI